MSFFNLADYAEQMHRLKLFNEDFQNKVDNLLKEMEPEDLSVLRTMFYTILSSQEGAVNIATHYEGYISGLLTFKHEVCTCCGKDHLAELIEEEGD